jgi:hypothetical protein
MTTFLQEMLRVATLPEPARLEQRHDVRAMQHAVLYSRQPPPPPQLRVRPRQTEAEHRSHCPRDCSPRWAIYYFIFLQIVMLLKIYICVAYG